MFAVAGRPRSEVTLEPGLRITFADGLEVEVEAVRLPEAVLALEGEGLPSRRPRSGIVASAAPSAESSTMPT
ncbi:MAG: hypothetical protein Q8P41_13175 [Pseudomonadota bacterium]|nr:hypothetical protein [Pseudomonadota bacterium]